MSRSSSTKVTSTKRTHAAHTAGTFGEHIFDLLLDELYVFDAKTFKFVQANRGAQQNLGYSMTELSELTPWDLKPEHSESTFREMVEPLFSGETEVLHFETVHLRKDGSLYPVEVHLQLFADQAPPVFVAIILDISKRKEAEGLSHRLGRILEASLNEIYVFDAKTFHFVQANRGAQQNLGYSMTELFGLTPWILKPEFSESTFRTMVEPLFSQERAVLHFEAVHRRKDGSFYPVDVHLQLFASEVPPVFVAIILDISKRKQAEDSICDLNQRLEQEKERYELAVLGSADGLWDWDLCSNEKYYSPRFYSLLGYSSCEIQEDPNWFDALIHPDDKQIAGHIVTNHLRNRAPYDLQYRAKHKDGVYRWFRVKGQALWDKDGNATRMAGSISDITELKNSEEAVKQLAETDALTKLPNRLVFQKHLADALDDADRTGLAFGLMLLDLDCFKSVNDTLGHSVGDALLCEVAGRVLKCLRKADTVARLGGDEFAIVAPNIKNPVDIDCLASRIVSSLAKPFNLDGREVHTSASMGITVYPKNTGSPQDLLRNADLALYRAKEQGRGTYYFYEKQLSARLQAQLKLDTDLRKAIPAGEFELYYQPLFNLEESQITGLEALMRWRHPEQGLISPAEFISVAEETGLIVPLGEWAIRQACAQAATWPDRIKIAVNLSPVQFRRPGLVEMIASALAASGLLANRLELEVTETVLLDNNEANLATLHQLRGLGVRIGLDDFGTGYSSLSYLQSFPFDKIKIDHSFIKNITTQNDSIKIVKAIVTLARGLGMTTTAEGVERKEQFDAVRSEGCDEVQGYFISRPRPAEDIERLFLPRAKARNISLGGGATTTKRKLA